jgi:hypothetical protein
MVLELRILLYNKVAIQQINKHKLMKQGGGLIPSYNLHLSYGYINGITLK